MLPLLAWRAFCAGPAGAGSYEDGGWMYGPVIWEMCCLIDGLKRWAGMGPISGRGGGFWLADACAIELDNDLALARAVEFHQEDALPSAKIKLAGVDGQVDAGPQE